MLRDTFTFNPRLPRRASPALLIMRSGLPGLLAASAITLSMSVFAQEPGKQPDPNADAKAAEAAEAARRFEEARKKFEASAEAQGFKPEQGKPAAPQPQPHPQPAPQPKLTPAPTHAPATINQPKPAAGQPQPVRAGVPAAAPAAGGAGLEPADIANALKGDPNDPNAPFLFDFTEPVELIVLVDYVRRSLDLQILFLDGGLKGQTIFFNTPVTVKKKDVLTFLVMLLEQREYTMIQDPTGVFIVQPKADVPANSPDGAWSTTRVIYTPNIKPSALQANISSLIAAGRAGQAAAAQPIFMDDLGLIIMTGTPRMTGLVEDFVNKIVEERAAIRFYRFELQHIAAASAKDRVLELLGQQAQQRPGGAPGAPNPGLAAAAAAAGGAGGSVTNLGDRITVDPTSNRLFLRGRADEQDLLKTMLEVVDVPNGMDARFYAVGYKTAVAVAAQGKAEQLGTVNEFEFDTSRGSSGAGGAGASALRAGGAGFGGGASGSSNSSDLGGGAGFLLYPEAGGFMYRGTPAQHQRVEVLISSLKVVSAGDPITYEFYKLKHGKSADVAEIIQNLISNTASTGNRQGGLLGRGLGGANNNTRRTPQPPSAARTSASPAAAGGSDGAAAAAGSLGEIDGAEVFVLADEPNNQVLVKAPAKLQPQFRTLISKIDLRRPQVYIDAKIVVLNETDDFRLAIEAQQIIGQFAFNTNFGLGSLTTSTTTGSGDNTTTNTTGGITSRKNVNTGLDGITAALIRSKDVPIVINAMSQNINTRIIATPQLLVDDNEEAEISSLDQQPTGTTSQSSSAGSTITGFQGFESAGPKLKVKPQISEGGYMRLEYSVELSAFNGAASGNLPPPKIENKVDSKSSVLGS